LLRYLAFQCDFNIRYPILKLLKAICRLLLINEFESIFFAYVVQTNRWRIDDEIIRSAVEDVRDIVCYSTDDEDYKAVTLYLMLCGYTVKYYLNENVDMYAHESEKVCPNFRAIFEQWAKQYAQTTLRINPKSLNSKFKEIYLKRETRAIQTDYNSLVDSLLQISPCYNPDKAKNEVQPAKEVSEYRHIQSARKAPPLPEHHKPVAAIPHPAISTSLFNLSILSSSGLHQTMGNSIVTPTLKKKQMTLGSSGFGLEGESVGAEVDADIRDVTLGIQTVESDCEEPDIHKRPHREPRAEDEGLALTKNVSHTSQYLFQS
jgi:hypothetical protein